MTIKYSGLFSWVRSEKTYIFVGFCQISSLRSLNWHKPNKNVRYFWHNPGKNTWMVDFWRKKVNSKKFFGPLDCSFSQRFWFSACYCPKWLIEGLKKSKISCQIQTKIKIYFQHTVNTFLWISGEIFTLLSMFFLKKPYFWTTVYQSESAIWSDLKFPLIRDPWTAI